MRCVVMYVYSLQSGVCLGISVCDGPVLCTWGPTGVSFSGLFFVRYCNLYLLVSYKRLYVIYLLILLICPSWKIWKIIMGFWFGRWDYCFGWKSWLRPSPILVVPRCPSPTLDVPCRPSPSLADPRRPSPTHTDPRRPSPTHTDPPRPADPRRPWPTLAVSRRSASLSIADHRRPSLIFEDPQRPSKTLKYPPRPTPTLADPHCPSPTLPDPCLSHRPTKTLTDPRHPSPTHTDPHWSKFNSTRLWSETHFSGHISGLHTTFWPRDTCRDVISTFPWKARPVSPLKLRPWMHAHLGETALH